MVLRAISGQWRRPYLIIWGSREAKTEPAAERQPMDTSCRHYRVFFYPAGGRVEDAIEKQGLVRPR